MTAPSITWGTIGSGTAGGTISPNVPTVATGDLILLFVACDSTISPSTPTGFTRIAYGTNSSELCVYAKIYAGAGWDGTLFAPSQDYVMVCGVVPAAEHTVSDVSTDILLGTLATGSSTAPNPPSASGTAADYLSIAACAVDLTTGNSISAVPSGYTSVCTTKSANSTSSVALGVATKALSGASSEDPAGFTSTSRPWIAQTLLIPPAATSANVTLTSKSARKQTTANTSSATNTVTSDSITPTAGKMLVVMVGGYFQTSTPPRFTVADTFGDTGGSAWKRVDTYNVASGYTTRSAIFRRYIGTGGSAGTITVTRTAGTFNQWLVADFYEASATTGTIGMKQSSTRQNASATIAPNLQQTPQSSNNVVLTTMMSLGDTDVTQPSGHTTIGEVVGGSTTYSSSYATDATGTGVSWTGAGTLLNTAVTVELCGLTAESTNYVLALHGHGNGDGIFGDSKPGPVDTGGGVSFTTLVVNGPVTDTLGVGAGYTWARYVSFGDYDYTNDIKPTLDGWLPDDADLSTIDGFSSGGGGAGTAMVQGYSPPQGTLVGYIFEDGAGLNGTISNPSSVGVAYWASYNGSTYNVNDLNGYDVVSQYETDLSITAQRMDLASPPGPTTHSPMTGGNGTTSPIAAPELLTSAWWATTITGTSAWTETADTASGSGAHGAAGTEAWTEGSDTASASGSHGVAGTSSWTEAADTASGSGTATPPTVTGTAAWTDAADTASAAGAHGVAGTAAFTETGDTSAASGSTVTGTAAWTETGDTCTGSGTYTPATVSGTAAWTAAADTATASGSSVTGSTAWAETADTASAAGGHGVAGTSSWTETSDTAAAAGTSVTGTASWTEASDTVTASGTAQPPGTSGDAAWTEASDTAAASGVHGVSATSAWTETADTASATGSSTTGSAAFTEAADTVVASGTFNATGPTGPAAWTEASDTAVASGAVGAAGTSSWTESADSLAASGAHGVSGSMSWTDADDAMVAAAVHGVAGPAAFTETADGVVATGSTATGTSTWTEGSDSAVAAGGHGPAGTAAWTETGDTLVAAGFYGIQYNPVVYSATGSAVYRIVRGGAVYEVDDTGAVYRVTKAGAP